MCIRDRAGLLPIAEQRGTEQQQFAETKNRHEGVVEIVRDPAGHLTESAEAFLLDDLLLRAVERRQRGVKFGIQGKQFVRCTLAVGDVLERALEVEKRPVGIADSARILRHPDFPATRKDQLRFEIGDGSFSRSPQELREPLRFRVKLASGIIKFGDELRSRLESEDAGERWIGAQESAIGREQKDAFDSVFKDASIFLLGQFQRGFGALALLNVCRGIFGEPFNWCGEAAGNKMAGTKPDESHKEPCTDDLPADFLLVGECIAERIKADLEGGCKLRPRIESFVEDQMRLSICLLYTSPSPRDS